MTLRLPLSVTKRTHSTLNKSEDWIAFPANVEPHVILGHTLRCLDDIEMCLHELQTVSDGKKNTLWITYLSVHVKKLNSCMVRFLELKNQNPMSEPGHTRPLKEWSLGQKDSLLELRQRYTSFRIYARLLLHAEDSARQMAYITVLKKELYLLQQITASLKNEC